jgi:acyl-CoA thioester hydrolase
MNDHKLNALFSFEMPIRWGDMDAYAHVNNTLYLRYMEEARILLLQQMGYSLNDPDQGPVVVNLQCSFLQPVVYPDNLTIECFADKAGNSSFMSYYKLYSKQQQNSLVCEGSAKLVWIDKKSTRSRALPDDIRYMIDEQKIIRVV